MKLALSALIFLLVIAGSNFNLQAQKLSANSGVSAPDEEPKSSQRVSKADKSQARRLHKEGVRYGRAKLFRQAAASFQKAVQLDPNYADAYYGLGQAYIDLGRWREAIDALERVIKLDPDEQTYTKLGEAYAMWREELKVHKNQARSRKTDVAKSSSPTEETNPAPQTLVKQVTPHRRSERPGATEDSRIRDTSAAQAKPPATSDNVESSLIAEKQRHPEFKTISEQGRTSNPQSSATQPQSARPLGTAKYPPARSERSSLTNRTLKSSSPGGSATGPQARESNRPGTILKQPTPAPRRVMVKVPAIRSALRLEGAAEPLVLSGASEALVNVALEDPPVFVPRAGGNGLFAVNTQPVNESTPISEKVMANASILALSFPEPDPIGQVQLALAAQPVGAIANVMENQSAVVDATEFQAMTTPPAFLVNSGNSGEEKPVDLTSLYRVGVGDVLDIRLRDAPGHESTLFTVSASGLLEHPILSHPLRVVGLTTKEIGERVSTDLKNRAISDNPEVMVGVREYVSHTIIVSGLIKDPGTKILRREAIPLYVVLADAQPLAEAGRALIVSSETRETRMIDLADAVAMNHLVRPGDVVTVQPRPKEFFYIGGEVKLPGEKLHRPGLTLMQAVLAAGGVTGKGKEAEIARESENGLLTVNKYKLKDINGGKKADPVVSAGDRITVRN